MTSSELSKEEKLDAANKAREEVKQLLSFAKEGSVNGVRRRDCQFPCCVAFTKTEYCTRYSVLIIIS